MELLCYEVEPGRVTLRPARHARRWMDETPNGFAHRCMPLVAANTHGWEILSPISFTAEWSGGPAVEDLAIRFEPRDNPGPAHFVESHFGHGVLTFNPKLILRTPPGCDVWLCGPPNNDLDGIAALSAVIETEWMPYTFSMNWRFTRAAHRVGFERGEPIGFFFPVERGTIARSQPRLLPLAADPDLQRRYQDTLFQRNLGAMTDHAGARFEGWYAKERRARPRPKPFA